MVEITGLVHAVELHTASFKSFVSSSKTEITGMLLVVKARVEYLPTLPALAIVESSMYNVDRYGHGDGQNHHRPGERRYLLLAGSRTQRRRRHTIGQQCFLAIHRHASTRSVCKIRPGK